MRQKLGKLRIVAVADIKDALKAALTSGLSTFEAQYNPETYSTNYKVEYKDGKVQGQEGSEFKFNRIEPRQFKFDFIIDATIPTESRALPVVVDVEVKKFLVTCGKLVGSTHRPGFLVLSWGTMVATCVMESADITYSLFSPEGIPLRAKISATFKEHEDNELMKLKNKYFSPDLTHTRTVKAGDNLPALCKEIYGDKTVYLEVARINKISNFRNLQEGTVLKFPPLTSAENL